MTARRIMRRVAERLFGEDVGCGDHGCLFGHRGGMGTNGGCQCLKENNPVLLRRTAMRLSELAKVLAAVMPEPPK